MPETPKDFIKRHARRAGLAAKTQGESPKQFILRMRQRELAAPQPQANPQVPRG